MPEVAVILPAYNAGTRVVGSVRTVAGHLDGARSSGTFHDRRVGARQVTVEVPYAGLGTFHASAAPAYREGRIHAAYEHEV